MKLIRKVGATSEIWQIFIQDSSSTTGAGLTGLAYNSGSLTAYYHRDTDTTATAITLVTMTVGTFTSSGFKEIDSTNMPGWYQFCPPNAALASGAKSCAFLLKGASNMAPLAIEVDLDSQVDVTHWNGTAVTSPNTAGTPVVDLGRIAGTTVSTSSAQLGVNVINWNSSAVTTPNTAGTPVVDVGRVNNVSTSSVTTVNANVGTTQPVNFSGTGSSATIKSNLTKWGSSASDIDTIPIQTDVRAWNGNGVVSSVNGIPIVDMKYILGTAVTETSGGRLAGRFTGMYDVTSNGFTAASALVTTSNLPTNFSALSITSGGVAQADVRQFLGTAVTETSGGRLAGRFTGLFDVTSNGFTAATSLSTYAGGDTSGTTTLLSRLTSTRAGLLDNLTVDVSLIASSVWGVARSGHMTTGSFGEAIPDAAAGATGGLSIVGSAMALTSSERNSTADALLGRNIAGGSSTGRTVSQALYFLRNKVVRSGTSLIVYQTDDSTQSWTATLAHGTATDFIDSMTPN